MEQHDERRGEQADQLEIVVAAVRELARGAASAITLRDRLAAAASSSRGVDVAERVGLVVERHRDDRERRVPRVDLAAAVVEERGEMRQHVAVDQREHRMRLVERLRDGELRALARRAPRRAARRDRAAGTANRTATVTT